MYKIVESYRKVLKITAKGYNVNAFNTVSLRRMTFPPYNWKIVG